MGGSQGQCAKQDEDKARVKPDWSGGVSPKVLDYDQGQGQGVGLGWREDRAQVRAQGEAPDGTGEDTTQQRIEGVASGQDQGQVG